MALITDPDDLNQATEVTIDTGLRTILLSVAGNLSNDGVTLQALYSFLKEEWKTDPLLIPHQFPMVAITPEQFELVEDWTFATDTARKLVRTGGWREIDDANVLQREYVGVITLGTFEDNATDTAYYQQGNDPTDTTAAVNFDFPGPVNEAVLSYVLTSSADAATGYAITANNTITRNDGGNWAGEGYQVGGKITLINCEDAGNNGTWHVASAADAIDGALTVTGSPLTNNAADTTMQAAINNRNVLTVFLRVRDGDPNGKTYAQSTLTDIGVAAVDNKVFRYPLANATDLKISETDANIDAREPYTEVTIRYFDSPFWRQVDSGDPRQFGIVINAQGSHSGVDGASAASVTFTTAEGGMTANKYDNGTLKIHSGSATLTGSYSINTNDATTITLDSALPTTETGLSFTVVTASVTALTGSTLEAIYEKVQRELRQAADIDSTSNTITGRTASELLEFVGETLKAGGNDVSTAPVNPNGGGTGVIIEEFLSADTNRLEFQDNLNTASVTFPFVAAGTINFNANLQTDGSGSYWMFFEYTTRTTVADMALSGVGVTDPYSGTLSSAAGNLPTVSDLDYINLVGFTTSSNDGIWQVIDTGADSNFINVRKVDQENIADELGAISVTFDANPINSPDAIVVQDNSGVPISGTIGGAPSVNFDFDYDNNVQGGRTAATDAVIRLRAIGFESAQFVETNGTITRATGLVFTLVAALERNYDNP